MTDAERQPCGDIIDALGVTLTRHPGELLEDCIVIMRSTNDEGTALSIGWSDGLDWVTRLGMLHASVKTAERESLHDAWSDPDDT